MEYTDGLFEFPVKVYDTFSIIKNIKEESERIDDLDHPLPDDWVEGMMCWPLIDIQGYGDNFSNHRKTGEVAKEGFDLTTIYTHSGRTFECTWTRERLKKELNKFAREYEKGIEGIVTDAFKEKEFELSKREQAIKKKWWRRNR